MMKGRHWALLPLFLVVPVCCGLYWSYRTHEYLRWKATYRDALRTYRSAYDFRDSDDQVFVQRLRDFQKAMGALDQRPRYDDHTELAKEQLRACAEELDLYRHWMTLNSAAMSLRTDTDFEAQRETEQAAGSCVRSGGGEGVIP
jgi:hypothetical protein